MSKLLYDGPKLVPDLLSDRLDGRISYRLHGSQGVDGLIE